MLSGLTVYHDFDWRTQFGHNKTIFPKGVALARAIRSGCPQRTTPALLLTCQPHAGAEVFEHESEWIVVVTLDELRAARADIGVTILSRGRTKISLSNVDRYEASEEAVAVLASRLGPGALDAISRAEHKPSGLSCVDWRLASHWATDDPEGFQRVVEERLTLAGVLRWMAVHGEEAKQIAATAPVVEAHSGPTPAVIDLLRATQTVDSTVLEAVRMLFNAPAHREARLELLRALASDASSDGDSLANALSTLASALRERGLSVAEVAAALANRDADLVRGIALSARLAAYRRTLDQLRQMVAEGGHPEHAYQRLLGESPWLFGSEYSELLDRRTWVRDDNLDFMLRRTTDRYLEIVEIKTPVAEPLFNYDQSHDSHYPSASLSRVLGQVVRYIDQIDRDRDRISVQDREDPFKIRAKVIIGRDGDDQQRAALRQLNGHLHRIEVLTFEQLVRIGERVVGAIAVPQNQSTPSRGSVPMTESVDECQGKGSPPAQAGAAHGD